MTRHTPTPGAQHVLANRRAWDRLAGNHEAPGTEMLTWGWWRWPEHELQILGDIAGKTVLGEGLRTANGAEMSYRVLITPDFDRTFEILKSDFGQIGVRLEAQSVDTKALAAAIQDNGYGNYDLALTAVQAAPTDPDFTLSSFTCRTRGIYSLTGYCDEGFDRLYQSQRTAGTEDQRVNLVHQLQEMIYRARPFVGLSPNALVGVRPAG